MSLVHRALAERRLAARPGHRAVHQEFAPQTLNADRGREGWCPRGGRPESPAHPGWLAAFLSPGPLVRRARRLARLCDKNPMDTIVMIAL
jgi:hypothetical protein